MFTLLRKIVFCSIIIAMLWLFLAASWSSVIFTLHCKTKQCKTERMFWDGQPLSQPCWSHCLSYEFEVRKEAYKMCRLRAVGIAAALKEVLSDNEHRTQHRVQLISFENSSGANDATIARLEKEVEDLKSAVQCSKVSANAPQEESAPSSTEDVCSSGPCWLFFSVEGASTWKSE